MIKYFNVHAHFVFICCMLSDAKEYALPAGKCHVERNARGGIWPWDQY